MNRRAGLCRDYAEHYILTFPSGYGKSILAVPWVELRGKCNTNCSKMGYMQISSPALNLLMEARSTDSPLSLFSPNDKKPFCSFEGTGHGGKYEKYSAGAHAVFTDTTKLPRSRGKRSWNNSLWMNLMASGRLSPST